jgi:hypothetical protein
VDNIEDWLNSKIEESNKKVTVQREQLQAVVTELKPIKTFPWSNVFLGTALLVALFFLFNKNDNVNPGPGPEPNISVVKFVESATREYPKNLSISFNDLAEQVSSGKINNSIELLANAKALSSKSLVESLGKINQLDNDNIPKIPEGEKEWNNQDRDKVVKYLKQKAEGHLKASK